MSHDGSLLATASTVVSWHKLLLKQLIYSCLKLDRERWSEFTIPRLVVNWENCAGEAHQQLYATSPLTWKTSIWHAHQTRAPFTSSKLSTCFKVMDKTTMPQVTHVVILVLWLAWSLTRVANGVSPNSDWILTKLVSQNWKAWYTKTSFMSSQNVAGT